MNGIGGVAMLRRKTPLRRTAFKRRKPPSRWRGTPVAAVSHAERVLVLRSGPSDLRAVPKKLTHREPKYRAWLRKQRCAACGAPPPNQASHHGEHGVGLKPDDNKAIPLCNTCHIEGWHLRGMVPGAEEMSREERREWFRNQADAHYARYQREAA